MSAAFRFESAARRDYDNAISYYVSEVDDERVAERFVNSIESAVATICAAPEVWRVVERPDMRRFVLQRFPFVIYYQYQLAGNLVVIYAVAHTSRHPGSWRERLRSSL